MQSPLVLTLSRSSAIRTVDRIALPCSFFIGQVPVPVALCGGHELCIPPLVSVVFERPAQIKHFRVCSRLRPAPPLDLKSAERVHGPLSGSLPLRAAPITTGMLQSRQKSDIKSWSTAYDLQDHDPAVHVLTQGYV